MDWQQKSYSVPTGTHILKWVYARDSSGEAYGANCGWVDHLQGPGTTPPVPDLLAQALDCSYSFTTGGDSGATWGTEDWRSTGDPLREQWPTIAV